MLPGQGGHGGDEDGEGLEAGVAELESGAGGDIEADARTQFQDFLIVTLLTPDLACAFEHIPDFLNGTVDDRGRGLVRWQGEVVELSAAAFQQKADGRAVRGGGLGLGWEGSALHGSIGRLDVIASMVGYEGRGRVYHVVKGNDVLGARGTAAADYLGSHVEPVLAEVGETERAVTGKEVASLVDAATDGGHGVVPDICICPDHPIEGLT